MYNRYPLLLILIVIFTFSYSRVTAIEENDQELPKAEDPSGTKGVPDYNLTTLKGTDLRLSSLRGKVVLIDFFMAQCPHCRKQAPYIAQLTSRYRSRGLVVLSFSSNNQHVEQEIVEEYAKEFGLEKETIVFSPMELFELYLNKDEEGILPVPQAVLFNVKGQIAARFMDWETEDKKKLEEAIEKELNQAVKK
jgi:peroxiredoxin